MKQALAGVSVRGYSRGDAYSDIDYCFLQIKAGGVQLFKFQT